MYVCVHVCMCECVYAQFCMKTNVKLGIKPPELLYSIHRTLGNNSKQYDTLASHHKKTLLENG